MLTEEEFLLLKENIGDEIVTEDGEYIDDFRGLGLMYEVDGGFAYSQRVFRLLGCDRRSLIYQTSVKRRWEVMSRSILYVYVMNADTGFAPCYDENLFTLACCKGGKRGGMRTAVYKDWIKNDSVWVMGVCGKKLAEKNSKMAYAPIYIAKITDVKEMTDYYKDNRYNNRKDHKAYYVANGILKSKENYNPHYDKPEEKRDIGGRYVLFSRQFTYWGKICEKERFLKESPVFREIIPAGDEKEGIARHFRGYMVKRDFYNIDEICKKDSWFPKEGEVKILFDEIGDQEQGCCGEDRDICMC